MNDELSEIIKNYNSNKKSIENISSNNENLGKIIKNMKTRIKKIISS